MISLFTPLQVSEMSPGWEGPTPSTPLTTPPGGGRVNDGAGESWRGGEGGGGYYRKKLNLPD